MKRLLAVLTLAVVAALAPTTAHASIGNTDMVICSSINSASWIWPHELPTGYGGYGNELRPGQCRTYHNNLGQLRVYVPTQSYKYGPTSSSYGACKNAPWDSDPPNSANGGTETYKDYVKDDCKN